MKRGIPRGAGWKAAAAIALCAGAARGATVSLNFNGSNQFTPNFALFTNAGSQSPNFTYSSTAGVLDQSGGTAGGGVASATNTSGATDGTATYTPTTFNLTDGATDTISIFTKYVPDGAVGDKALQIGFVNGAGKGFNGNGGTSFISARIFGNSTSEIQYAVNGATTSATGSGATFSPTPTSGDWIQLTLTLADTNNTTGAFNASYSVQDYGASGTATPVSLASVGPISLTVAGLGGTALANTNAGFRYSYPMADATDFDNFAVTATATPEPAGLGLLGVAAGAMLARRRRPRAV